MQNKPEGELANELVNKVMKRTKSLAVFAWKKEKSKHIWAAVQTSEDFKQYDKDFEWVRTVDYNNTELYGNKLKDMSKG